MQEGSNTTICLCNVQVGCGLFRSIQSASHKAFPRFVVLLGCLLICSCQRAGPGSQEIHRAKRLMMGTLIEVVWRTTGKATEFDTVRSAMDRMEALTSRMSLYSPDSELARINAGAGHAPVRVSDEVLDVIEKSLEVSRMTQGAFDVTVGSVEAVWGDIQREGGGKLPREGAIEEALQRVGFQRVKTDRKAKTVFLEAAGMRLDLGGIAKGYIVDQGMSWLTSRGIPEALISAGGDIRASGGVDSLHWRIGLQDPFERGKILGIFLIRAGAVVTSGTYERYLESEEGRFAHILDPSTGRPVEGVLSATVIANESFLADALATALMVKGRQDGISLLRRIPSVKGVLIEQDGTIWVDERLRNVLNLDPLPARYTVQFYGSAYLSVLFPADGREFLWPQQGALAFLGFDRDAFVSGLCRSRLE